VVDQILDRVERDATFTDFLVEEADANDEIGQFDQLGDLLKAILFQRGSE